MEKIQKLELRRNVANNISKALYSDNNIPTQYIFNQKDVIAKKVAEVVKGYEENGSVNGISSFLQNNTKENVADISKDFRKFKYTDTSSETLVSGVVLSIREWSSAHSASQQRQETRSSLRKPTVHGFRPF